MEGRCNSVPGFAACSWNGVATVGQTTNMENDFRKYRYRSIWGGIHVRKKAIYIAIYTSLIAIAAVRKDIDVVRLLQPRNNKLPLPHPTIRHIISITK